jgi:hypothetical protein
MLLNNDGVDNGGLTESQQESANALGGDTTRTGDYAVMGTTIYDPLSYTSSQQQQPTRNRLADRIRQLNRPQQQQPNILDDDREDTTTTTSDNVSDDKNELYLQVKQGIVQIKSKEQHTYVLQLYYNDLYIQLHRSILYFFMTLTETIVVAIYVLPPKVPSCRLIWINSL